MVNFSVTCNSRVTTESQARYFFQHLISGVEYLHNMRISHRDLKLENTLVDLTTTPVLKICDFGFSKGGFDSQPKTQIGDASVYIARGLQWLTAV